MGLSQFTQKLYFRFQKYFGVRVGATTPEFEVFAGVGVDFLLIKLTEIDMQLTAIEVISKYTNMLIAICLLPRTQVTAKRLFSTLKFI